MDDRTGRDLPSGSGADTAVLGADELPRARDLATGAAIGHPQGWVRLDPTEVEITLSGSVIALAWPERALVPRQFRPNIMVSVELVPADEEHGGYTRTLTAGLLDTLPGAHVMSVEEVTLAGGHRGQHLVAAYRTSGYAVALRQYWVVSDGIVTSVAQSSAVESFDALAEVFESSMRGFVPAVRVPMELR
jgi:hypothetical protein